MLERILIKFCDWLIAPLGYKCEHVENIIGEHDIIISYEEYLYLSDIEDEYTQAMEGHSELLPDNVIPFPVDLFV